MRTHNTLAILFPNRYDGLVREMTAHRALGSLPFGGRYRLVDFALSDAARAGVTKVGIYTKGNYQSLMDHIGSGKAWDLSRKNGGLYFWPPGSFADGDYDGRIRPLLGNRGYLAQAEEEHVLLMDCHLAGTVDLAAVLRFHTERAAAATSVQLPGGVPAGIYVLRRDSLLALLDSAPPGGDFAQLLAELPAHAVYTLPHEVTLIDSLSTYFAANMALLEPASRAAVFPPQRPVYTKVRDCAPALYGLHADVTASLVADGCKLEGTARRAVLFRDVCIGAGATVEESILLQGTVVEPGARLSHVICDKNVTVSAGTELHGHANAPLYIAKGQRLEARS